MILRRFNVMLAAVGLACSGLVGAADGRPPMWHGANCAKPACPREALQRGDAGISTLGFLIRADGTVAQSVVLNSSGSKDLDRETGRALSKCVFRRVGIDGEAIEHWQFVAYKWVLDDDPELTRDKREAALAAKAGDAAAYFRLSQLLSQTATTDAQREHAVAVLRDAAERGHAHAQYQLGLRYQEGNGVATDNDEAMRWFEQAAKQDEVFALQRLKLGTRAVRIDE